MVTKILNSCITITITIYNRSVVISGYGYFWSGSVTVTVILWSHNITCKHYLYEKLQASMSFNGYPQLNQVPRVLGEGSAVPNLHSWRMDQHSLDSLPDTCRQ